MTDTQIILRKLSEEGLSQDECLQAFREMRADVLDGADPEELLYDIGLEPDYIFGLL